MDSVEHSLESSTENLDADAQKGTQESAQDGAQQAHEGTQQHTQADTQQHTQADTQPHKTIAVIDGNSLMHRAFHAVPPTMTTADGRPTNACFGFLAMLLKFIELAHPSAIVCAFDAGRPKWRMEAIEQYKAQRPPMDENLKVQFEIIEDLLCALAIPVVRIKGWEGDDILGTIAARDEKLGIETLLVTGD